MVQKLQTWLIDFELGDNWNGIMKDTLREECDSSEECLRFEQKTCATDWLDFHWIILIYYRNCCVNQYFAPLFFVVFVLMAQFVSSPANWHKASCSLGVGQCGGCRSDETPWRESQTGKKLSQLTLVDFHRSRWSSVLHGLHVSLSQSACNQCQRIRKRENWVDFQVKFEDLFLVQCFKLCALATNERMAKMLGRDTTRKQRRTKAELTHKIETYFD